MFIRSPTELAMAVISQRKKLKLSQDKVAKLVGLKQKTISAFENKPENTELMTVFRILSAVNMELKAIDKNVMGETKWKEEW